LSATSSSAATPIFSRPFSPRTSFCIRPCSFSFFFFNDTATTEIYTLSLHDALPIYSLRNLSRMERRSEASWCHSFREATKRVPRSEEHTSELQSLTNLVCRLLLEKKKKENHRKRMQCTEQNLTLSQNRHAHLTPIHL